MKKIGILGGTFNPIHLGHLIIAEQAYEQFDLDLVWFMPSKKPPHKSEHEIVSEELRKNMIHLAIDKNLHFDFSSFEFDRDGTTYTAETLTLLRQLNPDHEYYFILGEDSLLHFETWKNPDVICENCRILVAQRNQLGTDYGETSSNELTKQINDLKEKYHADIQLLRIPNIEISSKEIRRKCHENESIRYFCPDRVTDFILKNRLYQENFEEEWKEELIPQSEEEIRLKLQKKLTSKRYMHTLGVQFTATSLAMKYGENIEKASLSGLLHDCGKYLKMNEQIEICRKFNIPLSEFEVKNPALVHAKTGAFFAKYEYGISDTHILDAISVHTTGKPDMTGLQKILFVADYIEPGRHMDCSPHSLAKIRKVAFENLDDATLMVLENTMEYLSTKNQIIDSTTKETMDYYKKVTRGELK